MSQAARTRRGDRYAAVLFDLFGTLVATGDKASRERSLGEMGRALRVDPGAFTQRWLDLFDARVLGNLGSLEETIERVAKELGGAPTASEVQRAARIRLDFSRRLLESDRTVLSALDELRDAGLRLALVSDTSEETVRLWPASPLATRLEVAVFSCLERVRKPAPRIYRVALDRLGLPPSECAFVGDGGSHELTGATRAGLTAYLYRYPGERQDAAYRVDAEIEWRGPELRDLRELRRVGPSANRSEVF